jgi:hypothetical protein
MIQDLTKGQIDIEEKKIEKDTKINSKIQNLDEID